MSKLATSGKGQPPKVDSLTRSFADNDDKAPKGAILFHNATAKPFGIFSNFHMKTFEDLSGRSFKSAEQYVSLAIDRGFC
jgi:predicted NAD-dependent protein-ADP-ribosyltransferase YbiA (DUF1768 family)